MVTSFLTPLIQLIKRPGAAKIPPDSRSHRFVAVIDCILNQNVRDAGAAGSPAINFELLQLCHEHHVGILQMPCPEIAALGFKRARKPGQTIRAALDTELGRKHCAEIARTVADRIASQVAAGDQLLAILGGNPLSPGCAVHIEETGLRPDSGIFIKALQSELGSRGLSPSFRGIRDYAPELLAEDLLWFRQLLTST